MLIVAVAWLYVALMMAVAEALHPDGHLLGAVLTFLLYGVGPVALLLYLMGTPLRWRARVRAEQAERAERAAREGPDRGPAPSGPGQEADGGGHPPGDAVAPERKEG